MKRCFFIIVLCTILAAAAFGQGIVPSEKDMLLPGDFFPDFPKIHLGMSFAETKAAFEKTGAKPAGLKDSRSELVWDSKFDGMMGRATVLLESDKGLWEIAVVLFAMEEQSAVYTRYKKKLTDRHGPPTEIHDDSMAISNVWRLKNGVAIELRSPKDVNSPVVDIHWVKL